MFSFALTFLGIALTALVAFAGVVYMDFSNPIAHSEAIEVEAGLLAYSRAASVGIEEPRPGGTTYTLESLENAAKMGRPTLPPEMAWGLNDTGSEIVVCATWTDPRPGVIDEVQQALPKEAARVGSECPGGTTDTAVGSTIYAHGRVIDL